MAYHIETIQQKAGKQKGTWSTRVVWGEGRGRKILIETTERYVTRASCLRSFYRACNAALDLDRL